MTVKVSSVSPAVAIDDLRQEAAALLGLATPYDYQLRVAQHVLAGGNVVLEAPTGAGKTEAALLPFLYARRHHLPFADRLIYAVPMRTLASSLYDRARLLLAESAPDLTVTIQMGSQPGDPLLEGDVIFTTIDQVLSAYVGSPVSLPGRSANLVGAATIGSYLVFDEFHLLETDRALATTVDLARRLAGLSRVLLMSATVTAGAAALLGDRCRARFVQVADGELSAMPSQHAKRRRFHVVKQPVSATAVLERREAHGAQRAIVVVNTVARAQRLYRDLLAAGAEHVRLLHSRFQPADRAEKEAWAQAVFGEGSDLPGILVAPQVVEVGLNLSAQALHTELAPAPAIFQRAGRCARFAGEEGDVYVYALPTDEDARPQTAPYEADELPRMERTFKLVAARQNRPFSYQDERAVVEAAYAEHDLAALAQVPPDPFAERVATAMANVERSAPRELIRDVDSVSLAIHDDPTQVRARSRLEAFSLERGSFLAFARRVLAAGRTLWTLADVSVGGGPVVPIWQAVSSADALRGVLWACVSPASASYDGKVGLELDRTGTWRSAEVPVPERTLTYRYRRESYAEHVGRTLGQLAAERPRYAVASRKLAARLGIGPDVLERLTRLAVALHDVCKLTPAWQDAAWRWQAGTHGTERSGYLAHTDLDLSDPAQQARLRDQSYRLPSHAPEGGYAASPLLQAAADLAVPGDADLAAEVARALFSAIARHHGATTSRLVDFALPSDACAQAQALLDAAERAIAVFDEHPSATDRQEFSGWLSDPRQHSLGFLLYWYVARRLRLADQRATAEVSS